MMDRPKSWSELKPKRCKWLLTIPCSLEWVIGWIVYRLSRSPFIHLLDIAAKFTIVVGIWYYISETDERRIEKQVQAWQMISVAQQTDTGPGLARALELANQSKLNLSDMVLTNKYLARINLSKANLQNADLHGSNLEFANLSKANLDGADLRGVNFGDADLRGATMTNTELSNKTRFRYTDLSGADFSEAKGAEVDFSLVNYLHDTIFRKAQLPKAIFAEAEGTGVDFRGSNLSGARMRASLKKADFKGATLTGVSFFESDLHGANFTGADIAGAIFVEAYLLGTDLSGALNAKQKQFEKVNWDVNTKWPPGIHPPDDPQYDLSYLLKD